MNRQGRRTVTLLGSAALTLGLCALATAEDGTLTLAPGATVKAPGGRIKGMIQSESPTEVRIANQTIPVDQIESVEYDGVPQSFATALVRERAGAVAEAADLYARAATEAGPGKPLISRAAQFQRARILADLAAADPAKVPEALQVLDQFTRSNPNARQLGPALELLAKLCMAQNDYDRAEKAAADLDRIPWAAGRSTVLQARILGRRGRHDEAIAKIDAMLAASPTDPTRRRDGQLAKAEALAGLKRFAEAESLIRDVIDHAPAEDAETLAAAYNAMGDCLSAAGKFRDALIAYLHTDILFAKDKREHPRALARIVEISRQLKMDDQAKTHADRLRREYPSSPFAAAIGNP